MAAWSGSYWGAVHHGQYAKQLICVGNGQREEPRNRCRSRREIADAAHRLDSEASSFARSLDRVRGYSHLYQDAMAVSSEANRFSRSIESARSCRQVEEDFRYVAQEWRHLRQGWQRAHDQHRDRRLEEDYRYLRGSYRDVKRSIGIGRNLMKMNKQN
jgi:hypothetical protein